MKRITVKVDDEFHRRIRILSATVGKPISEKVRECLEEWLKEAEQEEGEDGMERRNLV